MTPARRRRPAAQLADPDDMLGDLLGALEEKTGHRMTEEQKIIAPGTTFRQWCEKLGEEGLKVDGKPFTLKNRPAMAWVYDQIPSTEEEAFRLILVLMKCAQVGFTVMEMLACIYLGLRFGPATVGMFLPDMNLAGGKSTERFVPMVRSVPKVHELMTQDAHDGTGRKKGEGNVNRRRIGQALFIFSWSSGRSTTESFPMDVLSLDEVQEMTLEQIEKVKERLSASEIRFIQMGSTANWPDADIDYWFKKGSMHEFHTYCAICDSEKPLDDYFPDCIKYDPDKRIHRYVCPKGHWLPDTQAARPGTTGWIPKHPEKDPPIDLTLEKKDRPERIRSIHFPQFLSPTISAGEIIDAYRSATDMKNFFNRKRGKPYLDPSLVPVNLEHLRECERQGLAYGLVWLQRCAEPGYMGIDQMGNYNVVVIKRRLPDGRQAVSHLEEVYDADPFQRCSELMAAFSIVCCVVEINPNYNDAKRFAARHPGKVFICDSFGTVAEGMIQWGDGPKLDTSDRRTTEEDRDRYTLRMDQYKCMDVSLSRFTAVDPVTRKPRPLCLFPDSQGLVQEVIDKGIKQLAAVAPRAWHHFTKTALVSEKDEDAGTNKYKRMVKKIGIDPHFSYANMLCDVAWARAHGTSTFFLPSGGPAEKGTEVRKAEEMGLHGLPQDVASMVRILPAGEICGRCTAFDRSQGDQAGMGMCLERELIVRAADPRCEMYMEVDTP